MGYIITRCQECGVIITQMWREKTQHDRVTFDICKRCQAWIQIKKKKE
jgi:hypothetical protein